MKEPNAKLQLVRSQCIPLKQRSAQKKAKKPAKASNRPKHNPDANRPKSPLSFPITTPLKGLRQRTAEGLRRLQNQGLRINRLSEELEEAMLEFKAMACEVNQDWKTFQSVQEPRRAIAEICQYQVVYVPHILQKPSGSFIVNSRAVDLFKAEREAAVLAKTLRHRARRKQLKG
jgi:hypothetical protein